MTSNQDWRQLGVCAALILGACQGREPPGNGGQIGEEVGAHCEVVERTPLARDEVSPLGFAAGPMLDRIVGEHAHTLRYANGTETALSLTITEGQTIEYLVQEVVSSGEGEQTAMDIAPWCPNLLSMGVTLGFQTEDGAFTESWEVALLADTEDVAYLTRELEGVSGGFDPWAHVPAGSDYDELRAWLDLRFEEAGASGEITGQGSGVIGDPADPESVAYAESFDIAAFGAIEE